MFDIFFDCNSSMQICIGNVLIKIRFKIRASFHLRHMFFIPFSVSEYKIQIWSSSEYSTGTLLMASDSQTGRLFKM